MTRVEFSSKSNESLETLRSSVIGAINAMVKEARSRIAESEIMESRNTSGIYRQTQISEDIVDSVFVGNSVMESIFLGIPPVELGQSPFALPLSSPVNTTASEVRLSLAPCGSVHWLPAVAGHVGSDTVGVAIAVHHLHGDVKGKGVRLILDIGTNCELVLEHEGKVFAASSPTGPAFEGAHISCGMRATRGAIERVRIGDNLEVALKLIGEDWQTSDISQSSTLKASGICGSGIIEVVSELLRVGILSNTGKFVFTHKAVSLAAADNNPSRLRKHTAATGEFVLAWAHETTSGHELTITTRDIRAIQLAKAALHAGSMMLLRAANCGTTGSPPDSISNLEHQNPQETSDTSFNTGTNSNISRCSCGCALSEVLLAGAFGSYLDPVHATAIGMLPQCLNPQSVRAIGNAAGDGAAAALVSHRLRDWARSWAKSVHYVELAGDPTFQSLFVDSMAFTH
ncbi:phenol hydroxylase P5 protein [Pelomyxa schiedti]|nr:phenol hydroxylase P5 protein [Pelomyxa schiedti]